MDYKVFLCQRVCRVQEFEGVWSKWAHSVESSQDSSFNSIPEGILHPMNLFTSWQIILMLVLPNSCYYHSFMILNNQCDEMVRLQEYTFVIIIKIVRYDSSRFKRKCTPNLHQSNSPILTFVLGSTDWDPRTQIVFMLLTLIPSFEVSQEAASLCVDSWELSQRLQLLTTVPHHTASTPSPTIQ